MKRLLSADAGKYQEETKKKRRVNKKTESRNPALETADNAAREEVYSAERDIRTADSNGEFLS